MSRTVVGVTCRGLPGTKLKPSASAPMATARSASSSVVMPQIFTNTHGDGTGSGRAHPAITLTPPRSTGQGDPRSAPRRRNAVRRRARSRYGNAYSRWVCTWWSARSSPRSRASPTARGSSCGCSASSWLLGWRNEQPVLRTLFDWLPLLVILAAYDLVRSHADSLIQRAHLEPMIWFDELIGFGTAPTVRLQDALFDRATPALVRLRVLARLLQPLPRRHHRRRVRVLRGPGTVRAVRLHVPRCAASPASPPT